MTIRVGPTEKNPTHHIKLTDVNGVTVGLILSNDKGEPAPMYNKTPVVRTALKTTSGGGSYADYNLPYSPIVQDNWSGGRASLDFERDTTRFLDSYRMNTRRENVAFLGAKDYFSKGYKSMDYTSQADTMLYYGFKTSKSQQFTASATYDVSRISAKIYATAAGTLDISLYDAAGTTLIATAIAVAFSDDAIFGEWVVGTFTTPQTITSGTTYTIKLTQVDTAFSWIAMASSPVGGPMDTGTSLYLVEPAQTENSVIYYEYKGQQYKVVSPPTGAPSVWMNGDRGVADSNAGNLDQLIDATKAWATDQWAGCVVKLIQGTGTAEIQVHRNIVSNTATQLVCDENWIIQHDTTTEYVILGSDTWREQTGHGLTYPVTSVLSNENAPQRMVYFAQGESATIRSHIEYNNAGTWSEANWRGEAANYATHLVYQPLAQKIWRSVGSVAQVSSATPAAYGTDLTFGTAVQAGPPWSRINSLNVYPSDSGTEALWIFKEEIAYILVTQAEAIKLDEMKTVRGQRTGKATLIHNVYQYFTLGNGLERYYGGNVEDLGPNLEEGLPTDRDGPLVALTGYPGRMLAMVDGGSAGYSSILERSGGGWHEIYRAPLGQRLKAMAVQVIPGDGKADRLWIYQGSVSIWMTLSSNGTNELKDTAYRYTQLGGITLARMHAGLYDLQKIIKKIKLWWAGQVLVTEGYLTRIALDYRLDDTEDWTLGNWETINAVTTAVDENFGLTGKRIQLRVRLRTDNIMYTPQLQAVIVDAVVRSEVKYMYNLNFRLLDDEPTLAPREMDDDSVTRNSKSAMTKLAIIEDWGDATTPGLLYMESNSPLYNAKYVFINPPVTRQIALDPDQQRDWTGNGFICSTTAQEA